MKNWSPKKNGWFTALFAGLIALSLIAASCINTTASTTTAITSTLISTMETTTTTSIATTATTTSTTTTTTSPATSTTTTPATSIVLTLINGNATQTYTLAQLQALQSDTNYATTRSISGVITGPNSYVGVRLTFLLKTIGGMSNGEAVRFTSQNGSTVTLSYAQVYQGAINVYDQTGNAAVASNQPYVTIIYAENGSNLDTTTGPVETGIITGINQVSDASMWLQQTNKIEILRPITLNVCAASSLANVLKAIDPVFIQANPNITISLNTAASGTLQTQIENGAPADVFISAAVSNMDSLQKENLIVNTSRKNLLDNTLVLIVPNGSTLGLTSISDLATSKVTKIAVGDPASVPAGTYASLAFTELGITTQIQSKLVLCANVTQVLTTVASGNVDAGLVYSTDALSSNQVKVVAQAPADINAQIVYPEAVLSGSNNPDWAQAYLNFLSGTQAVTLFKQYGFTMAGN
ncbi:MAG: molybdate ABC transporter substrate-binding protein [Dehalococcoidales bacterium]